MQLMWTKNRNKTQFNSQPTLLNNGENKSVMYKQADFDFFFWLDMNKITFLLLIRVWGNNNTTSNKIFVFPINSYQFFFAVMIVVYEYSTKMIWSCKVVVSSNQFLFCSHTNVGLDSFSW